MYRPKGSAWLVQDVKPPAERSTVLVDLHKGQEYEVKIRPYFDEFQGMDSEVLLVRTPEEGICRKQGKIVPLILSHHLHISFPMRL